MGKKHQKSLLFQESEKLIVTWEPWRKEENWLPRENNLSTLPCSLWFNSHVVNSICWLDMQILRPCSSSAKPASRSCKDSRVMYLNFLQSLNLDALFTVKWFLRNWKSLIRPSDYNILSNMSGTARYGKHESMNPFVQKNHVSKIQDSEPVRWRSQKKSLATKPEFSSQDPHCRRRRKAISESCPLPSIYVLTNIRKIKN